MEKIKSEENTIQSLYDKNGIQQCETSQILKLTENYYSDLFGAGKTNKHYHSFRGPNVCLAQLQMELCRAAN